MALNEDPDPSDMDDPDADPVIDCPHCHKSVHEDAEFCHHCGQYILEEDSPTRRPVWLTITIILVILLTLITWLIGR